MSQPDPAPANPRREVSLAPPDEQLTRSMKAFGALVERITPWLFEIGSWIFGGLIAFTLVAISALLTVGPADPAIMVSTVAFAIALPLNVTGLVLLKLVEDLKRVGFEEELTQAFREAGIAVAEHAAALQDIEALRKRRTSIVLRYSLALLALSVFLTVIGLVAALWHMAWWVAAVFLVMVLLSPGIVVLAAGPGPTRKQK